MSRRVGSPLHVCEYVEAITTLNACAPTPGATEPIKAGICCTLKDAKTLESPRECCGLHTRAQCDSHEGCIWYQIGPEDTKEFDKIIKAYPKHPTDKPASAYRIACKPIVEDKQVQTGTEPGAWYAIACIRGSLPFYMGVRVLFG